MSFSTGWGGSSLRTAQSPSWIRQEAPGATVAAVALFVGSAIPLPPRHNPDFGPYGPDKLLHLLGHGGLTAAFVAALDDDRSSLRAGVVAVVLSTVFGIAIELLQEAVPGREFERGDVVAGLLGSLVGVLSWHLARIRGNGSEAPSRP